MVPCSCCWSPYYCRHLPYNCCHSPSNCRWSPSNCHQSPSTYRWLPFYLQLPGAQSVLLLKMVMAFARQVNINPGDYSMKLSDRLIQR